MKGIESDNESDEEGKKGEGASKGEEAAAKSGEEESSSEESSDDEEVGGWPVISWHRTECIHYSHPLWHRYNSQCHMHVRRYVISIVSLS